jgi:hypothetical protein
MCRHWNFVQLLAQGVKGIARQTIPHQAAQTLSICIGVSVVTYVIPPQQVADFLLDVPEL